MDVFRVSLLLCYIGLGSAGALLVKATEVDGKIRYSTVSVVFRVRTRRLDADQRGNVNLWKFNFHKFTRKI